MAHHNNRRTISPVNKRDNDFVAAILDLADQHFSQDYDLVRLQEAVAKSWTDAEANAHACGNPMNRENTRWAIRRILFQPDLWPEKSPQQSAARRAALERALVLCKDRERSARMPSVRAV